MITNINSRCSFVLTGFGAKVWNASFLEVPPEYRPVLAVAGQTIESQLWVVMQVFGPHIMMGMAEPPFENNNLDITPC